MKKLLLFFSLVLASFIVSCTPKEYGEISIIKPGVGSVVREPYNGMAGSVSTPLWLKSTFNTEKNVEVYITSPSGSQGPWYCLVPAETKIQCPGIPLGVPGNYKVYVSARLIYGGVSEASAEFSWNPYSNLDKAISYLGVLNATRGYFVVYLTLLLFTGLAVYRFTKDPAKVYFSLGMVTVLSIPLSLVVPSAQISIWMSCYLLPLAIVFMSVGFQMVRHPRPPLIVIRSNGTAVAYQAKRYIPQVKQVQIHASEINRELDVSERKAE